MVTMLLIFGQLLNMHIEISFRPYFLGILGLKVPRSEECTHYGRADSFMLSKSKHKPSRKKQRKAGQFAGGVDATRVQDV